MPVRPLNLFDLASLGQYRRGLLALDSARAVTRGDLLGISALLPFFTPGQRVFTAVQQDDLTSLMGQVTRKEREAFARISFLTPADVLGLGEAETALIEHLVRQAGDWGALHVVAEVDERSPAFKSLRKAGFSMYAWQKIWQLADSGEGKPRVQWTVPSELEMLVVQSLYTQIVPTLVQPVDVLPRWPGGMIYSRDGNIQMYAALASGPAGVWVQPLVHPDAACVADCLHALAYSIPRRAGRPVYLCIRSYQAWLEATLQDMGAKAAPQQAVMVKHMAAMLRDEAKVTMTDKVFVKPAAPISIRRTHTKK